MNDERWYLTGPAAIAAGLLGVTIHPIGLLVGPLAVMLPVWVYRSRGSRDLEHLVRQLAYEMQDSVQAMFAVASGTLFALLVFSQTVFSGTGDLLAVLGGQAAHVPIPLAYVATTLIGFLGLDAGSVSAEQFAGFALIAFAIAYAVREVSNA